MIKKTFKTLIKHPLIILAFAYNFVMQIYEYFSVKSVEALGTGDVSYANIMSGLYMRIAVLLVFSLVYLILFMPALHSYIYEICAGAKRKGWMLRGVKRCTGRFAAYAVIEILVAAAFVSMLVGSWPIALLMVPFMLFGYSIHSGLAVEDNFEDGMTKGIRYGSRIYFKMLGLIGLGALIFGAITAVDIVPDLKMSLAGEIAVSAVQAVAVAFLSVYNMHWYLRIKSGVEIDTEEVETND